MFFYSLLFSKVDMINDYFAHLAIVILFITSHLHSSPLTITSLVQYNVNKLWKCVIFLSNVSICQKKWGHGLIRLNFCAFNSPNTQMDLPIRSTFLNSTVKRDTGECDTTFHLKDKIIDGLGQSNIWLYGCVQYTVFIIVRFDCYI